MSERTSQVPGLANGQEIVGSDWAVMRPGIHHPEFESVVIDEDGTAYLVSAIVSAQPLTSDAAKVAQEAAMLGESPILAVRQYQATSKEITNLSEPAVEAGEHIRNLGAWALANEPPK
jgi:hypothetical protein